MKEIGFWDYSCPRHGSLEHYTNADWDVLLDDMVEGGFNSLVLSVKWLTTGYRSRYSWLEQDPGNSAVASDNAVIHYALNGARQRNIRTWLLVVATGYVMPQFGIQSLCNIPPWGDFTSYDLDQPGIQERIHLLFDEIADLFGAEADGIVVELEFCDGEAPHRVPLYNEWAKTNGRPDFAALKAQPFEPRGYPYFHWRDFTTERRIAVMKDVEKTVRARGFKGRMAALTEVGNADMVMVGNTNLGRIRAALPDWSLVTYDSIYDRRQNRLSTIDFCIEQPRRLGFEVLFLTRGVMTWTWPPDGPPLGSLDEQWRLSLEDARDHNPDILWFMGSDARLEGLVCNRKRLPAWGYEDGRTARQALMRMAYNMGVGVKVKRIP